MFSKYLKTSILNFQFFLTLKIKKMKQIIIIITMFFFTHNIFAQNLNCVTNSYIWEEDLDSEAMLVENYFSVVTGTLKQDARVSILAGRCIYIQTDSGYFEADSENGSSFLASIAPIDCSSYSLEAEVLEECDNISRDIMHEAYAGEKIPGPNLSGVEYSDLAYYPGENMLPEERMLFMPLDDAITNEPNTVTTYQGTAVRHAIRAYNIYYDEEYAITLANMPASFTLHENDDDVNQDADFEGLTYLRDNYFAMVDEYSRIVYFVEYDDSNKEFTYISSFDISGVTAPYVKNDHPVGNKFKDFGIEGISYNPNNNHLYCITEGLEGIRDIAVFEFEIDSDDDFTNLSLIEKNKLNLSQKLRRAEYNNFKDAAGIYHLGKVFSSNNDASERFLVISEQSNKIMELDMDGNIYGSLMNVPVEYQPEGIAYVPIDNIPQIVVSSEGQKKDVGDSEIHITAKISKYTNTCVNQGSPKLAGKIANHINVSVSPNPVANQSVIKYNLMSDAKVSVYITDVLGNKMATLVNSEMQYAGLSEVTFNASELPTGVYFCTVKANDKVSTQKLIKAN